MTLPRTNRSLVTVALAAGLLALGACTSSTPNTRVADRDTDVVDETPPEISHEHDATSTCHTRAMCRTCGLRSRL